MTNTAQASHVEILESHYANVVAALTRQQTEVQEAMDETCKTTTNADGLTPASPDALEDPLQLFKTGGETTTQEGGPRPTHSRLPPLPLQRARKTHSRHQLLTTTLSIAALNL